jgi:hypothetical protein
MNDLLPVKFDAGGEVYYSDTPVFSAPPPPPPRAQNSLLPANFDWTKDSQIIDGITYTRGVEGQTQGEGGAWEGGSFNNQIFRHTPGQNIYDELDPTGQVVARHKGYKSRGFFGDLWNHASSIAQDVAPVMQFVPVIGQAITAINAINAAARGDVLPAIGTLAGMGGYTDVANAAKIANAVKNEDVIGAVVPALGIAGLKEVGGVSTQDIGKGIGAIRAIESGNPLALLNVASSYLPGPAMHGTTGNEITEGFFDPGGPGFMPTEYLDDAEVDRELQSLLGRYPAPQPPSDWFLGENIASGIPEWDMAAVNAGLPIGNLEEDFMVNERGQIVDSAGNVGNFVNGEFVVDTGVTPNLSYAATSAPAPAPSAAPGKAPAPKAQSGFDPRLFSFLMGMMNQDEDKPDPYQVAQINTPSPFGTIYDQQQDLLGLMGRG